MADLLREYVELIIEKRLSETEVQVSDGKNVPFGHDDHVKDLEAGIADMARRRDAQRRGSEARATFARAIHRMKNELKAARRMAEKRMGRRRVQLKKPKSST